MYRIAICDDDPIFSDELKKQVQGILFSRNIEYTLTVFHDPQALLDALDNDPEAFHLLLLDIILGGENGISVARLLRERRVQTGIIFITVSPSFALEGYAVRPVQYLLKPVAGDKLREAILYDYEQNYTEKRLLITSGPETYSFAFADILYIEVYNHTLRIHEKKDTVDCPGVLADIEAQLPDRFLRCHKSYLVNLDWVTDIRRYSFQLLRGENVPISKGRYGEIQQAFITYATR